MYARADRGVALKLDRARVHGLHEVVPETHRFLSDNSRVNAAVDQIPTSPDSVIQMPTC